MIQNYLTIAWRNLLKHKSFSFINILGLAIGLAACLIIFLYVQNELTYDRYNANTDRIARATIILHSPESDMVAAFSPDLLAGELVRNYPEVEAATRLLQSNQVVRYQQDVIRENAFYETDAQIFKVFSFDFIAGDPAAALTNPKSIVLSASMAKKYFGDTPPLGKTLHCNGEDLLVTGIFKDRPVNSDIHIDALLSKDFSATTGWITDISVFTFILFKQQPQLKAFELKLNALSEKIIQPEFAASGAPNYSLRFKLEPLADVHFSEGKLADTPKGNKTFIYIFSILAVVILVIALLNYINLSTARSMERAKEVGIRKVSGAGAFQLVRQFMFESFLLVAIAWLAGIGLVFFSLPFFNSLLQTKLSISQPYSGLFLGALFLFTLLAAGIYPAFVLSGFRPVAVLKGSWKQQPKGIWLRKWISIAQFAMAAALIVGTMVIYNQVKFLEQKDLGFNKDQVLSVSMPSDSAAQTTVRAFHNALRKQAVVKGMTVGARMSEEGLSLTSSMAVTEDGRKKEMMCNFFQIDPDYLPLFQIKLLEGRNLSDSFATDKNDALLVNEAYVQQMGWKSGLGKQVDMGGKATIVGVVKNFYYRSLHNMVEPLILVYNKNPQYFNTATIKTDPAKLPMVQQLFKQYFPALPFEAQFYDDIVAKRYDRDRIMMSLFKNFTLFAIFVSCLGLYGLVTLIAVQRTKEIGIRKVLGATINQLFVLLSKDFMRLVLIALVIALPLAGFMMYKWLNTYAYHVSLQWTMFIIPALLILLIALTVISWQIIKTALANPVKSLGRE